MYLDNLDPDDLHKRLSISKILRRTAITILILAVIFFAFICALAYKDYKVAQDAHVVEVETIIEEE